MRKHSETNKTQRYQLINGYKCHPRYKPETIKYAMNYRLNDGEIMMVTYPRCGTTWTAQICVLILNGGQLPDGYETMGIFKWSPFLDRMGPEAFNTGLKSVMVKTHIPFDYLNINPKAKYIYVTRNPKDALVSCYHMKKEEYSSDFKDETFDDLFDAYISGEICYGSWFDHILSWYKRKDNKNILFLLYENLKSNPKENILKIAEFLGSEYKNNLESNPEAMENILKYSNFSFMRPINNQAFKDLKKDFGNENFNIIRKGIVGDLKNNFSEEQNQRMNRIFQEKFKGTEILHFWDNYGIID